jgi:outer membrane protein OmpA-like peptidoglycan-associated protein
VDTVSGIAEGTAMDDRRSRLGRVRPFALAALVALAGLAPAWAQEQPGVKELLNRAQLKSQTQAVEDLIRRLKGSDPRPSAPSAKPPEPALPAAAKADPTPAAAKVEPPPQAASSAQPEPAPRLEPTAPAEPAPPQPPVATAPASEQPPPPAAPVAITPPPAVPPPAVPSAKAEVAEPLPSIDLEVHFDYKSAAITPQATDLLITLGRALADDRLAGQMFLIVGHTDVRGGDAYNVKLSQARAEAVRSFLIRHFSIAPERLRAEGHGFRQLKNAKDPYASENRRVQVTNITSQTARP